MDRHKERLSLDLNIVRVEALLDLLNMCNIQKNMNNVLSKTVEDFS